ncbi:hypothetical protein NKI12_09935 [Mesorhizobium australicum]|uniref:Uncharacterized protein n=1 Tax=Mesorhizobium australicum TaxID=536018 RepID=A0ACC6SWN4_9HYPH
MNIRTEQIVSRINNEALRQAATACLDVADRYKSRSAIIKKDVALTDIGRVKALRDEATKNYLPALQAAYKPIADAMAHARKARQAFSIPAPDPSNIAGALERQEIRAMLKTMAPSERLKLLIGKAVDERIADAVLTAPAALSGLEDHFDLVLESAIDRRFGDGVAVVRAAQEIADAAEAAMLVARNDIKSISGVDDRTFQAMEKEGVDTPWLKREASNGREIIRRIVPGASATEATGDEIAKGKFYGNYDEYLADHPGIARAAA